MGRSRSATLVLAFLMIRRNMTLVDAIQQVARNRCVLPNRGFLKQLRELDKQLLQQRRQAGRGDGGEEPWGAARPGTDTRDLEGTAGKAAGL